MLATHHQTNITFCWHNYMVHMLTTLLIAKSLFVDLSYRACKNKYAQFQCKLRPEKWQSSQIKVFYSPHFISYCWSNQKKIKHKIKFTWKNISQNSWLNSSMLYFPLNFSWKTYLFPPTGKLYSPSSELYFWKCF